MNSVYSGTEMNNASSGKKWIMLIQRKNEECLFTEEMNNVIQGRKE
jgi:hypothetical protein